MTVNTAIIKITMRSSKSVKPLFARPHPCARGIVGHISWRPPVSYNQNNGVQKLCLSPDGACDKKLLEIHSLRNEGQVRVSPYTVFVLRFCPYSAGSG